MLNSLSIRNFGLIDSINLEFDSKLNIFTGETGAGKSILIGALRIVLGERMASSQLRDGDKPCVLQAAFDLNQTDLLELEALQDFLTEDDPSSLLIHRTYQADGRSKVKINGLTATVGQLKEIGDHLVDFHGPHDHQMLLRADQHIGLLDRLIDFGKTFESYDELYQEYSQKKRKLAQLDDMKVSRERELDLVTHQVKELEQVPLEDEKYEELVLDRAKANNGEKLHEHLNDIMKFLDGDSGGSSENIQKAFHPMGRLNQLDESTNAFSDQLADVQASHDELILQLRDYASNLSFEPAQAQDINDQCDIYESIKRKYGPELSDARTFYQEAKEKYDLLSNLDQNDADLKKEIKDIEGSLKKISTDITKARKKAANDLKKTIEKELSELGIIHVEFEARVEPSGFQKDGADQVTFYISPNAGESLKPLADIVSSGEAARVMLALKKALIKVDPIPVLIFDEIDAQIGGRLGTITGEKLRDISLSRQVILITHLPQIASFANEHFKVKKIVKDERALTTVDVLNKESRIEEIAQMMSGSDRTDISVKHASDMLNKATK